ncbi:MAG: polysaccharide lyase family 7 protein [Gammaproteobacteria bacterium]|nr:polysaccharide lyase family 7 protein [Gammaproteobacteria bacterium]
MSDLLHGMRGVGILVLLGMLAACRDGDGGSDSPSKLPRPTGRPPSEHLDFSHWQLTLPVDAGGGTRGPAATVPSQQLVDGYTSAWFYATENDGVTFWAPVNGAVTPNSSYPRCELRELLDPADASVNWSSGDFAELSAFVAVHQTPAANGKLTIGQILGYNGADPSIGELASLIFQYKDGQPGARLYALVQPSPAAAPGTAQTLELTQALSLNEPFPYSIRVENKTVHFTSGAQTRSAPIGAAWDGVGLYFRAGAALHAQGGSGSDGGRATFYDLQVTH